MRVIGKMLLAEQTKNLKTNVREEILIFFVSLK